MDMKKAFLNRLTGETLFWYGFREVMSVAAQTAEDLVWSASVFLDRLM